MPLSDEEYRLVLEDAFDRHIRGWLRPSENLSVLEGRVSEFQKASQIARELGDRRDSDPPETTVFPPPLLQNAQATLVSALDQATAELEKNGFCDALSENWFLITENIRPDHLPSADFKLLELLGERDPKRTLTAVIVRLNHNALGANNWGVRQTLETAAGYLKPASDAGGSAPPSRRAYSGDSDAPLPPSRPRWWKGLGAIGSGSILSLFNCGLALSLISGFPVSPSDQTVGAISSAATGIGLIMQGIGEFHKE